MLKEKVTYSELVELTDEIKASDSFNEDNVVENFYEAELEKIVRFRYTVLAVRLYRQRYQREFLQDYGQATKAFTALLQKANVTDVKEISQEQQFEMLQMLTDPVIMTFVMDLIPCLYTEVHDGKFVQNDETAEHASDSEWMMTLVNIEFFSKVFAEITANMGDSNSKKELLKVVK